MSFKTALSAREAELAQKIAKMAAETGLLLPGEEVKVDVEVRKMSVFEIKDRKPLNADIPARVSEMSVNEIELTYRVANIVNQMGVKTVGELAEEMRRRLSTRSLGRKTEEEIVDKLSALNIRVR